MKITVITLDGKRVILEVSSSDTINDVKQQVEKAANIPRDQQRMMFAGKMLENYPMLMDYNIQDGNNIHLVLGLRGGFQAPDISKEMNGFVEIKPFCKDAPYWLTVQPGLFALGRCGNKNCSLHQKKVTCYVGIDTIFDIDMVIPRCPAPDCTYFFPENDMIWGVSECKFQLSTRRAEKDEIQESKWEIVANGYHLFEGENIEYEEFKISVQSIPESFAETSDTENNVSKDCQ